MALPYQQNKSIFTSPHGPFALRKTTLLDHVLQGGRHPWLECWALCMTGGKGEIGFTSMSNSSFSGPLRGFVCTRSSRWTEWTT